MKVISGLVVSLMLFINVDAQKFNGQWKGGFLDASSTFSGLGSNNIDYVLEIETSGKVVTGYSYTYFSDGLKQYYTICRLEGKLNKKTKEVLVTEVERTKSNTPPDFRNCFQTHLLKYTKLNKDSEQLAGTWIPAPNQSGDCGKGRTILYRKIYRKSAFVKPADNRLKPIAGKTLRNTNSTILAQKATIKPKVTTAVTSNKNLNKLDINGNLLKNENKRFNDSIKEAGVKMPKRSIEEPMIAMDNYKPRMKAVVKTLNIEQEKISVDFYDNGAVDGDSITVFFNGKIVVSHLGLTEKPATFTLTIDKSLTYNELVMYAENMGSIPPNTALMVVKDGTKQYEVNITSDTERNGTIRFRYLKKP